ncbi:MAG: DUF393 domain-containing protein [Acidobacteria bacterium]|nr:DUF393 domain-containing protein [Acidobacteriota bacterium]
MRSSNTSLVTNTGDSPELVLVFDGDCGFCHRAVRLILEQDRRRLIRFAAWQSDFGGYLRRRFPLLERIDSVALYEKAAITGIERITTRSDAILRLAGRLGGPWRILQAGYLLPKSIRDGVYTWFANHRHRLSGRDDHCARPLPETRRWAEQPPVPGEPAERRPS